MDHEPTRPAELIRQHLAQVAHLRHQMGSDEQARAVREVKILQARRFEVTYADLLTHPRYRVATTFFLQELYGAHDFTQRDAQFSRIAGAIERLFPTQVAELGVDMAELHALTERLDATLSTHWSAAPGTPGERYVQAWRATGEAAQRQRQLDVVMDMGMELQRLTRMASLRVALRMMRAPARAAGLEALQAFLEKGFDAFHGMGDARDFLNMVQTRESAWIERLFGAPDAAQLLDQTLNAS